MSDYLADGTPRLCKAARLLLSVESIKQFHTYNHDNITLSMLVNNLLADWITNQALREEFALLRQ
jgi:hypothetical protein